MVCTFYFNCYPVSRCVNHEEAMAEGQTWNMPDLGNNLFFSFTGNKICDSVAELIPQIIQAVHRRCPNSFGPEYLPLAAGHLAFQSFFFLLWDFGTRPSKIYAEVPDLKTFLRAIGYSYSTSALHSITCFARVIELQLQTLLEKMVWLRPMVMPDGLKESSGVFVRRNLSRILELSNWAFSYITEEENAVLDSKRFIKPTLPKGYHRLKLNFQLIKTFSFIDPTYRANKGRVGYP